MSNFKISPFFPDKNLNPQGWVTDFITSRLFRVGSQRSDLANLIYDEKLTKETVTSFKLEKLQTEIESGRAKSIKDKSFYLNPLYYDAVERNTAISAKVVEDEKALRDYYRYMINIKPNELSSFVPYVRLKFGYKQPNEKTFKEAEVPFVQNLKTEVASILADKFSRGQGAGIKSVSADRSFPGLGLTLNINVSITYFFSSISLVTNKISNAFIPEDQNFTYSKLFSFLPSKKQKLFLEYGYHANPEDTNLRFAGSGRTAISTIKDIIKAETKRIPLIYKSHKLDIGEDGTITVTANYLAEAEAQYYQKNDISAPSIDYISSIKNESLRSVFKNYAELNQRYYKVQTELQDFTENEVEIQKIGGDKKKLDKIRKQKEQKQKESIEISKNLVIIKDKIAPYVKDLIIDGLIKRCQLFSISFISERKDKDFKITSFLNLIKKDEEGKQQFVALGDPSGVSTTVNLNKYKNYDISVLENSTVGLTKENLFEQILINLFDGVERAKGSNKFGYITFFPLKALISLMYEFLPSDGDESLKYKIPFTCFGNVMARSFGREYAVNIGDVLIELETFKLWLHKNYVQKNRVEYSFSSFLRDMVEELVPDALTRKNTGFYTQNALGTIRHLTYYTKKQLDEKQLQFIYKGDVDFNQLKGLFVPESSKDAEPLLYFTQMLNPLNDYTSPYHKKYIAKRVANQNKFDLAQDAALGIPHVTIGASRGLIKKVNFNAIEQPFLATSLIMQSMTDGNTTLPRYAYNVSVDMFGNNLFNQAGFLAIPPFGVEGNADIALGLTGYYVVTKVTDNISTDAGYSTSINAIWHDNPLQNKQKGTVATTKDAKNFQDTKEYINFSVDDYIKDLLSLDPSTLKALGITANLVKQQDKTNEEKKNDSKKEPKRDRKEKSGAK
jgi:hypothetical protein